MPVRLTIGLECFIEIFNQWYQLDESMLIMKYYNLNHVITVSISLEVWNALLFETELYW